jgi:hypothetical protein
MFLSLYVYRHFISVIFTYNYHYVISGLPWQLTLERQHASRKWVTQKVTNEQAVFSLAYQNYFNGETDNILIWIHEVCCTVAYRPVSWHRPRNKQREQPLLHNRRINKRPFLSNGSVNEHVRNNRRMVFSMWSVQGGYKEENWVNQSVELCKGGWEEMAL